MASGSTPKQGESKREYGMRMTAARKRNPQRTGGLTNKAADSVSDW